MKGVQVALFLLIFVPAVINFYTPLYNYTDPSLGGMPFFYWFQIVLLGICVIPYLAFTYIQKNRPNPDVMTGE